MEAVSSSNQQKHNIPQDSDVYVNYYGLRGDPFAPEKPLFFTTPHLEKLHRLFNYLSRFSRKLVVVTGEKGAGKTALLEHFVQDQNEEDLVCYFAALNSDTPAQVLNEIADQLELEDVNTEQSVSELIQGIQSFSLARLDEGRSCIVVIDDAHLFESSVLEQLYLLTLDEAQSRCSIRLLLCGEPHLLQALEGIVPDGAREKAVFHQQISPFGFDETCQYLQVHFRENGGRDSTPFSASQYEHIFQVSQGLPGRINEAAKDEMISAVNGLVENDQRKSRSNIFTWLIIGAVVVVSAVFLWQGDGSSDADKLLTEGGLTGKVERGADNSANEDLDSTQIFAEPETGEKENQRSLASDTSSDTVSELLNESFSKEPESSESEVVAKLDDVIAAEPEELAETVVLTEANEEEPIEILQSEKVEPPADESLLRQHARQILAFNESAYTMQLLGSRSEDSILNTMSKLPGDKNLLYFEKTHKGEPWYVLIYGVYTTRAAADKAAASLPEPLGKLKPWVRGVSGIQKEVILPAY